MKILVMNAGSSNHKTKLYEVTGTESYAASAPLWEAQVDWKDPQTAELSVRTARASAVRESLAVPSRRAVLAHMLSRLWSGPSACVSKPSDIEIIGHRVVHGGAEFRTSTRITSDVKAAITRLSAFAPLHNPNALEGIAAVEEVFGAVPQVAVFDTAFHSHLPAAASVYPGPYEWVEQGIRRYGFHGISHRYCAARAAQLLGRALESLRLIVCHLGGGCSLAAIYQGRSIDTTMGFTPLEGLMMGSRSGSVDPGLLIYLLRAHSYTVDQLDQTLNQASGLLGVSGLSADMRQVLAAIEQGHSRAKLAFDIYVHRLRFYIGAMLGALGGLDALVFTAGVGENSPVVRAAACQPFEFLGLKLDPEKNAQSTADQDVATADSSVRVLVVATREEWSIAQECRRIIQAES